VGHAHHAIPSYDQYALSAKICQSWSQQHFTQEIERSIEYCISCGYSRDQAEQEVLEQHHLYLFPNFITSIKAFSGYRSYIKNLYRQLLDKQGKGYHVRKIFGLVNSGYKQLLAVTEKLHQEIVAQEKAEETQRAVAQKKHQQDKAKLIRIQHDHVATTFDAQRDELMQESREWYALLEIYTEEQVGNTTRIERRIQTVNRINNDQMIYTEQSYTLSSSAVQLIQHTGGDFANYHNNYGNQLQQTIHQECIDGIEHLATMRPSAIMHSYQHGIAECFDAAREYNQAGFTSKAATISDFCWTLLDYGKAIAEGAVDGVIGAVKDIAEHPVQAAICAVAGEYVLAYQLSKVLYNVADIGITALIDTNRAAQKWDDYIAPVTQLIDAIQHKQITVRDALKGATQFAVQWQTQDKLLKGLGNICSTAKTKAIEFARNSPLATPQDYMVTPDGILLKSTHNTPSSGSSLQYERSSRFFVSNHAEITALTEQAQLIVQPPKEVLYTLGRDSFNTPDNFLRHIFAAELKVKRRFTGEVEKSLSGFHHFIPEHLEEMGIKLVNIRTCKKTGVMIADVLCDGHLEPNKTFFPPSWNRSEVVKKLGEAAQNPTRPVFISGTRITAYGKTSEGIIVRLIADIRSGNYITAYPDARENGLL